MKSIDEYPDILQTEHLLEITGVCSNTLYKLLRTTQAFPVIKFGGKFLVPRKPFWEALSAGKIQ